jgi:hypothetical protein
MRFGLGPDYLQYESLRVRYARDVLLRDGYKVTRRALLSTPRPASAAERQNLRKRIRSVEIDLSLNLKDITNIREQARALIAKAAVSNPGMAVENGIETLLNCDFPPVNLSRKAKKAIGDEASEVFVSAASAWEIAIKVENRQARMARDGWERQVVRGRSGISGARDLAGAR